MKIRGLLVLFVFAVPILPAFAADPSAPYQGTDLDRLGQVHFPVSCAGGIQPQFDRAVALLHSFWFPEIDKAFTDIAAADPDCAMAYWGVAMSARRNPIGHLANTGELKNGWAAVEKAIAHPAKTQRERDYVAAVEAFYRNPSDTNYAARSAAYEKAMAQVASRNPGDVEASIFYALSLLPNEATVTADMDLSKQRKAGAILEGIFAKQRNHPGAAHYIIHAYDYSALAEQALPAARLYAQIAPASDHALHMPSHIFTRLGLWQDAIASNLAAADAAKKYALGTTGKVIPTPLHMMHFLMEEYLQLAQDREAKGVLDELNSIKRLPDALEAGVVIAGIPARYALERRQWTEAAAIQPLATRHQFPQAIGHYARAIGAARSGDIPSAMLDVEKLQALRDSAKQEKEDYWAQEIEVQRLAASGWLAHAKGRHDEAVKLLRAAAELEDSTQQHHTARDPVVPTRDLLGDLLIEVGEPAKALTEFETSLRKQRNRYYSLSGAARAAELAGNRDKAREFYAQLIANCNKASGDRGELQRARVFIDGKAIAKRY